MQAQQASIQPATFPVPIKGINSIASLALFGAEEAIYSSNIGGSALGLQVRPGFTQYGDDFTGDVTTIIPYRGQAEDGSEDFLFAATTSGIWDASTVPSVPTLDYTWVTSTADPAGICQYDIYTNDAGARVLLVADEANGIVSYVESTQTWAVPTLTGVTEANIRGVTTWKSFVWYVEADSGSAWYAATGAYSGSVTEFNFANKFSKGGYLKALYNWTLDSGEGPDDYLVAVSSAGDVVVYQGTNPAAATTFSIVGVWFIGDMPAGRRIGSRYGGDLLLLSSYGVISCNDLVRGVNPFTYEGSMTAKINRTLNSLMNDTLSTKGWEIIIHPDLAKIIIGTPKVSSNAHFQFVFDINVEAWSTWSGIPYRSGDIWNNKLYTGNGTNIYEVDGFTDDLDTLSTPNPLPVEWSYLSGYDDLEMPQMNKVVEMFRPRFIASGSPVFSVKAFYDYDLAQIAAATGNPDGAGSVWDTGLWDTAIWGGASASPFEETVGSSGMGRKIAVAMSGKSKVDTTLIDVGAMVRQPVNSRGML